MQSSFNSPASTGSSVYKRDKKSGLFSLPLLLRLLFCALILVVLLLVDLFSAEDGAFHLKISNAFNKEVNYTKALSVLGETVTGGKSAFSAIGEACRFAFGIDDENEVQSVIAVSQEETTELKSASRSVKTHKPLKTPVKINYEKPDIIYIKEPEKDTSKIDEFLKSQEGFQTEVLPDNVSYEMPDITLESVLPVKGTVSSTFGYRLHPVSEKVIFHYGTDIAADCGTVICSAFDGVVETAGDSSTYGKYFTVSSGEGVTTLYAHCGKVYAECGQTVMKGEKIAEVGDSGNATGYCLHFEVMQNGTYLNPEYYFEWN